MLIVKAVEDKTIQKEICEKCGAEYNREYFAYSAHEGEELIGICQFKLEFPTATITDLKTVPGLEDFEGMFILARGTLNFIDLCGIHFARCENGAGDEKLIHAVGFRKNSEDVWEMDLTNAFCGNCSGKESKK